MKEMSPIDPGNDKRGKRYRKIPDGEIKKYSQQWLTELYRLITPANLELFRDNLRNLADALDGYVRAMKKSKARHLGRPPGRYITEVESGLSQFVGSDHDKWTQTKFWINALLAQLKNWQGESAPGDSGMPNWTKEDFIKSIRTLLRGKPGAHKKKAFIVKVLKLRQKGLTSGQIARIVLRELHKTNPEKARNRVKKTIYRNWGQKLS